MAKRIKNPIEVKFTSIDGDTICSVEYGLECDCGLETRTGYTPPFNEGEKNMIEMIADRALVKIKKYEGIV